MDFDVGLHNDSYLQAVREVLSQKKSFLNFDRYERPALFCIILMLKCTFSGFAMVTFVPKSITYLFLFLHVAVQCLLESWWHLRDAIIHAAAHTGVLLLLNRAEEVVPSVPNNMIWSFYCLSPGAQFFLDCYFTVIILVFIWKRYSAAPHRLSLLICALYTVNWLGDQFAKEGTFSLFQTIIMFYLPVIFLQSFNTAEQSNLLPDVYVALWGFCKLSKTKYEESPAAVYKEAVITHFKEVTFQDTLEEFGKRRSFLNVDENEHYVVFYLLLLLKSFVAAYAVKNVVGLFTTLQMLTVNCIFSILDRNFRVGLGGLFYFIIIAGYQYVLCMEQYNSANNAVIWFCVSSDARIHFFLDLFLIASAICYINDAYEGDLDSMSTVLCFLYAVDWLSDKLAGESFCRITTLIALYLPVMLISASTGVPRRYRILLMVVFAAFWIVFRVEKEYFEYFVSEFIYTFYEISKAFTHLNDVLQSNNL